MQSHKSSDNHVAMILAAGGGERLKELTRKIAGFAIPKQFCPLLGEVSLLEQTRRRVSISVPAERTSFILNCDHERFFSPILGGVPFQNLVVQPRNRGTAPGILYGLLRLAECNSQAYVLLMPSDHYVADERAFMKYVDRAFSTVEANPYSPVLLGVTPNRPETTYGWIEPARISAFGQGEVHQVRRFWEKPTAETASGLMANGWLWNTLIMVAELRTMLGLFCVATPQLYRQFSNIRASFGTIFEQEIVGRLYEDLSTYDLSRDVLEPVAGRLSVLEVRNVEWSDLGEPERVARVRASIAGRQSRAAVAPA
jgi:mannose-1-phosphate guanylyltransferase